MIWLPLATAAVYCLPAAFIDPALAQYIARGWLGCLFAWALYRGWRINRVELASIVAWEGATSVCGAYFAGLAPAVEGMCDKGTGLPITLPSLALTVAACIYQPKEPRHG